MIYKVAGLLFPRKRSKILVLQAGVANNGNGQNNVRPDQCMDESNNDDLSRDNINDRNHEEGNDGSGEAGNGEGFDEVGLDRNDQRQVPGLDESDDNDTDHDNDDDDSDEEIEDQEDDDEGPFDDNYLVLKLCKWIVRFNIPYVAASALLLILRHFFPVLPKHAKTLLKSMRKVDGIQELGSGKYYHFNFKQLLRDRIRAQPDVVKMNSIKIQANIDGFPITNSTNHQFWPILIKVVGQIGPFAAGIFYGEAKPDDVDAFLKDFIDDLMDLFHHGLIVDGQKVAVMLDSCICDAPALALVRCTVPFNHYYGCMRCTQKGLWINHKLSFQTELAHNKRTDTSFAQFTHPEHHEIDPQTNNPKRSPFHRMKDFIGLVTSFPYEVLHLLHKGVFQRLILTWQNGSGKSRNGKQSNQTITRISAQLQALKNSVPAEFLRKPRSLTESKNWKATEWKLLLNYVGFVAFKGILDPELYEMYLFLAVGTRIFSNPQFVKIPQMVNAAHACYEKYVQLIETILGNDEMVYKVHGLLHVKDDIIKYGSFDEYSSYEFESYLGRLKKLIRKPGQPLAQIVKRIHEFNRFLPFKPKVFKGVKYIRQHNDGPVIGNLRNGIQYKKVVF